MKKLSGILMSAFVLAAFVAGPASASTAQAAPELSAAQTAELCKAFFAGDACDALAAEWAEVVATQDRALIRAFVDDLLVETGVTSSTRPPECRDIFADHICAAAEGAVATVRDVIQYPVKYIDMVRQILVGVTDYVVFCLADVNNCIAYGSDSGTASGAPDVVCREVFSDAVCTFIENGPGPVITWVYGIVRCYLDPACTPLPNPYCNQWWCTAVEPGTV